MQRFIYFAHYVNYPRKLLDTGNLHRFLTKLNIIHSCNHHKTRHSCMHSAGNTHCLDLDLNGKRSGVTSDGNFSSYLIGRSWYSKASRYTALSCTDLAGARFWIGSKKFEMNEFMKWKPWTAGFYDHLAFTLLSDKSCTNFELHNFLFPQKTCISRHYCTFMNFLTPLQCLRASR